MVGRIPEKPTQSGKYHETKLSLGFEKMAQQFRELSILPEDL